MSKRAREHSEQAFWWQPEKPDERLVGTVHYGSCQGFELELIGAFSPLGSVDKYLGHKQTLWGATVRNKEITLLNALHSSFTTHVPGVPTSTVEALRGVVGGHYRDESEILVHTVNLDFAYLTEWSQIQSIRQTYDGNTRTWTLTMKPAERVQLGNARGIEIVVVPFTNHHDTGHSTTLKEYCQLRLISKEARPFFEFEPIIASFSQFLSLAVGEPAKCTKVTAKTPVQLMEIDGRPVWKEIEVIRTYSLEREFRDIDTRNMLFTLSQVLNNDVPAFQQFLEKEDVLAPVFDLFFPAYFFDLPPPQELLNMAHAVEAFHRATIGGEYMPEAEYRAEIRTHLLDALPSAIDPDFKSSLERKLDFLHQFSLKRRLKDILRQFNEILKPFVGERDPFIQRATEARNRLVHASADFPAPDYGELWKYAQQLALVVEVAILSEIGFSGACLKSIVDRSKRGRLIKSNVTF